MKTRRSTKLFATVAAASLVLAACGGDDDDAGVDVDVDVTVAEGTAEPTDEATAEPTDEGTAEPTAEPTDEGTAEPTAEPTDEGTAEPTDEGTAPAGGTVAYGNAQEFSNYNNNLGTSNSVKNSIILNEVQPNPFNFAGPTGGLVMDEELMDSVELVSEDPQVVEYVVNADAVWSDGEPIDCDDFQLQYYANNGAYLQLDEAGEPVVDEESGLEVYLFDLVGTTGYDQMESVECSEDGKTITVTYAEPFADWQSVFGGQIPAHVIEREAGVDDLVAAFQADDRAAIEAIAETYNTLYTVNPGEINPDTMLSGGRLAFGSWEAGASFTLVPNENYWGTPAASDEIVVRYIAEEAQAQALANGEINAMDPQPTPDLLGQLEGIDNAVVETGSQYIWEHFDFNFNIPALQDIRVREAFAKCLPRQQMVDNLIKPLDPSAEVLNNRWIQPFEEGYQDNSGGVAELDIEGARALLEEAGQVGLPLRIGWFDNGGNQRRTDQVALTIESCNQAGFEMIDAGSETFFDVELAAGDWDIAMFAWAGSPLKSGAVSTYQAGAGNNVGNIAIPELEPLLQELLVSPDPAVQTDLANQIDTILWENIATIPVFSFPGVVAYTDNVSNVIYNPSQNGLTFNASEWQVS